MMAVILLVSQSNNISYNKTTEILISHFFLAQKQQRKIKSTIRLAEGSSPVAHNFFFFYFK